VGSIPTGPTFAQVTAMLITRRGSRARRTKIRGLFVGSAAAAMVVSLVRASLAADVATVGTSIYVSRQPSGSLPGWPTLRSRARRAHSVRGSSGTGSVARATKEGAQAAGGIAERHSW